MFDVCGNVVWCVCVCVFVCDDVCGCVVVDGWWCDVVEYVWCGVCGFWDLVCWLGGGGDVADGEVLRYFGECGVCDDGGVDVGDVGDDVVVEVCECVCDGVDGEIGDIFGREGV